LSDGLNSPLYQELREKRGLIYSINPCNFKCIKDTISLYYIMTTKENTNIVIDILKNIFLNIENYITPERFNDIVNASIIKLNIKKIFNYDNPKNIDEKLPSCFKTEKQLKNITIENIINIGKKYLNNFDINVY